MLLQCLPQGVMLTKLIAKSGRYQSVQYCSHPHHPKGRSYRWKHSVGVQRCVIYYRLCIFYYSCPWCWILNVTTVSVGQLCYLLKKSIYNTTSILCIRIHICICKSSYCWWKMDETNQRRQIRISCHIHTALENYLCIVWFTDGHVP